MSEDSRTVPGRPRRPPGEFRAPLPSSPAVRDRFRRQPVRDTLPELALRRQLHALGLRYRVDVAPLRGGRRRADIVFTRPRIAVFVDGCFWHSCPQHASSPRANADWWRAKLARTVQRDRDTDRALVDAGWLVLRVWEHEPAPQAAERVLHAWKERRRTSSDRPPTAAPAADPDHPA